MFVYEAKELVWDLLVIGGKNIFILEQSSKHGHSLGEARNGARPRPEKVLAPSTQKHYVGASTEGAFGC
jgi:hypothetical protein